MLEHVSSFILRLFITERWTIFNARSDSLVASLSPSCSLTLSLSCLSASVAMHLLFSVVLYSCLVSKEKEIANDWQLWLLQCDARGWKLFSLYSLFYLFFFFFFRFPLIHAAFWHQSIIAFPSYSRFSLSLTLLIALCMFSCRHVQQAIDSSYVLHFVCLLYFLLYFSLPFPTFCVLA